MLKMLDDLIFQGVISKHNKSYRSWEGSDFGLIIDDIPYAGVKPIKVNLPVSGLETTNITISALSTTGYEFCIVAFVGYTAQGSPPPNIPGFDLFIILGFLTISIIVIKTQIQARKQNNY